MTWAAAGDARKASQGPGPRRRSRRGGGVGHPPGRRGVETGLHHLRQSGVTAVIEIQQDSATAQGEVVLAEAVAAYRQILGPRLLAAYALGSLAHGGFSPLVSDVDLGLIIDHPLTPTDRGTIEAVA